jgi:hypothetical protein
MEHMEKCLGGNHPDYAFEFNGYAERMKQYDKEMEQDLERARSTYVSALRASRCCSRNQWSTHTASCMGAAVAWHMALSVVGAAGALQ